MFVFLQWYNAPRNFDSTSEAMLTLFELSTLDHWVEVFYLVIDSPQKPGFQPQQKGESWGFGFLVIFTLIVGNYLFMNLLVCGVVDVYDKMKYDSRHNVSRGDHSIRNKIQQKIQNRTTTTTTTTKLLSDFRVILTCTLVLPREL